MSDERPVRTVVQALEHLAALRRQAADALRDGDAARAQDLLELAEEVERELAAKIGA